MANPTTKVDLTQAFSAFLATAISDGTFSDVVITKKVDEAGFLAPASAIAAAAGELWSNIMDDFIRAAWNVLEGQRRIITLSTVGAVTDTAVLETLIDGDLVHFDIAIEGHGLVDNEVFVQRLTKAFYHETGTITQLLSFGGGTAENALAASAANVIINGSDIEVEVTGVGGTTISWTAAVVWMVKRRA